LLSQDKIDIGRFFNDDDNEGEDQDIEDDDNERQYCNIEERLANPNLPFLG